MDLANGLVRGMILEHIFLQRKGNMSGYPNVAGVKEDIYDDVTSGRTEAEAKRFLDNAEKIRARLAKSRMKKINENPAVTDHYKKEAEQIVVASVEEAAEEKEFIQTKYIDDNFDNPGGINLAPVEQQAPVNYQNYFDHINLIEAHIKGILAYLNHYAGPDGAPAGGDSEQVQVQIANLWEAVNSWDDTQLHNKLQDLYRLLSTDSGQITSLLEKIPALDEINTIFLRVNDLQVNSVDLMIAQFCIEEGKRYGAFVFAMGNTTQWKFTEYEVKNYLYKLVSKRQIFLIVMAMMKHYTHWLMERQLRDGLKREIKALIEEDMIAQGLNPSDIEQAIKIHINTYYKTMCEIDDWARIGMDWILCMNGNQFNVENDLMNDDFYNIVQLGKLIAYREECVHFKIEEDGDLKEYYKYTTPDFLDNSFSSLILTSSRDPFNLTEDKLLYPAEPIPLTDAYRNAALAFGTKDVWLFESIFKRRPYMFIFITTLLLGANKTFIAMTDSRLKKEYTDLKSQFEAIDETLKTFLPSVYSLELGNCTEPEKWYYRALGKFLEYEQKNGVYITSVWPWVNIEIKTAIMLENNLIISSS
jgi:hypothetical protein